jgi:hypothetical protein
LHENGATIPIVAKAARDQLNRPEEEAGSVLSTTLSYWSFHNLGDVTAFKKRANQGRAFRHSF